MSILQVILNRQPIKLMSNMKNISHLNLNAEKQDLACRNSKFGSLNTIYNAKKSSSTLVEALYLLYDSDKKYLFLIKKKTFSFCPQEVVDVLGMVMNDIDVDFDFFC